MGLSASRLEKRNYYGVLCSIYNACKSELYNVSIRGRYDFPCVASGRIVQDDPGIDSLGKVMPPSQHVKAVPWPVDV